MVADNELIDGGRGCDVLFGGAYIQDDPLFGGDDNDSLRVGGGDSVADGGTGTDRLLIAPAGLGRTLDWTTATIRGIWRLEALNGDNRPSTVVLGDTITMPEALVGTGEISGRGGNDTLPGGAGADQLFGNAGSDQLQFSADGTWTSTSMVAIARDLG